MLVSPVVLTDFTKFSLFKICSLTHGRCAPVAVANGLSKSNSSFFCRSNNPKFGVVISHILHRRMLQFRGKFYRDYLGTCLRNVIFLRFHLKVYLHCTSDAILGFLWIHLQNFQLALPSRSVRPLLSVLKWCCPVATKFCIKCSQCHPRLPRRGTRLQHALVNHSILMLTFFLGSSFDLGTKTCRTPFLSSAFTSSILIFSGNVIRVL